MNLLELQLDSFTYKGDAQPVLESIELNLVQGEILGVVGGGGSGKTTLAFLLSGYAKQFLDGDCSGSLRYSGTAVEDLTYEELLESVGYVNADPFLQLSGCCESVEEELCWSLLQLGASEDEALKRIEPFVARLGLEELRNRSVYALSGGQLQRVAFCSVLALNPQVLILDEVISQLDPELQDTMADLVTEFAAEGRAVVWFTSKVDECHFCHKTLILIRGGVQDSKESIKALDYGGALLPSWCYYYQQLENSEKLKQVSIDSEEGFWSYVASSR